MDSPKLSTAAKQTIATANEVYISSASIWEAGIKVSIGKLEAEIDDLIDGIQLNGFIELPITAQLPGIHRDPFDRMLVVRTIAFTSNRRESSEILETCRFSIFKKTEI